MVMLKKKKTKTDQLFVYTASYIAPHEPKLTLA